MIHVRGKDGGTLIRRNGTLEKVSASPQGAAHGSTYPAWHPSGKYIAYSMNEVQQFFHANGQKPIEVSDLAADLGVYDVVRHEMLTDSLIYGDGAMETFPAWSPDGRTLYFVGEMPITREQLWTVCAMICVQLISIRRPAALEIG